MRVAGGWKSGSPRFHDPVGTYGKQVQTIRGVKLASPTPMAVV